MRTGQIKTSTVYPVFSHKPGHLLSVLGYLNLFEMQCESSSPPENVLEPSTVQQRGGCSPRAKSFQPSIRHSMLVSTTACSRRSPTSSTGLRSENTKTSQLNSRVEDISGGEKGRSKDIGEGTAKSMMPSWCQLETKLVIYLEICRWKGQPGE